MSFFTRRPFLLVLVVALLATLNGCRTQDTSFTPYMVRLYLEESRNLPTSHITDLVLPISGSRITVRSKPLFLESDILGAAHFDTEFGPAIVLLFTPDAAADFYRTTISNQGRRFVLTINGIAVGSRFIERGVEDGRMVFFLEIEDNEVPEVARGIQRTSQEIQKQINRKGRW